jgi:nucleoside-diphosphate-sugar epimerase
MQLDDGRVVTNFIKQSLEDEDITVYGDGQQTRSFSYIKDTVSGLLKALYYEKSDIFNIGNDNEITINELAEYIIQLTNSKSKIINKPLPKDDPMQRRPDLTKSQSILGYKPQIDLEEGLLNTINWVKQIKS